MKFNTNTMKMKSSTTSTIRSSANTQMMISPEQQGAAGSKEEVLTPPTEQNHQKITNSSSKNCWKLKCTRTVLLRFLVTFSLIIAIGICTAVSFGVLRRAEQEIGLQTLESIAASALASAKDITRRRFQGSEVIATLMAHTFPYASQWLFVEMDGYIPFATKLAQLDSTTTYAFMVILDSQRDSNIIDKFEHHAASVYHAQGRPQGKAGVNDFGFGIWKPQLLTANSQEECAYEDCRLHDVSRARPTTWAAKRDNISTPLFWHNKPAASSLLYNLYSQENRGIHIDSLLDCVERHSAMYNTEANYTSTTSPACAVMTDILQLKVRPGPAGLIFQPVYPAYDPTTIVGFATTSIHWEEVLTSTFPDFVSGITAVVETDTQSYTYEIRHGVPHLLGEGDLHNPMYSHYGHKTVLNSDLQTGTLSSSVYTLTLYPTAQYFDSFASNNPIAVALGFFAVVAFCTLIFVLYDYLMRYEAQQKKAIMDMKRRFVRFISHEIRTPLNTVSMGIELLESELQRTSSGCASSTSTTTSPTNISSPTNEDRHDDSSTPSREQEQLQVEQIIHKMGESSASCSTTGGTNAAVDQEDLEFWKQVTRDIRDNAQTAVEILNDLLNYDKLETGTLTLEVGIVPIFELLQRTVQQFQIQAVNRKVDLQLLQLFENKGGEGPSSSPMLVEDSWNDDNSDSEENDIESGSPVSPRLHLHQLRVLGDDVKLGQVIRNLISNALKFTPANGTIQVTTQIIPDGLPNAVVPPVVKGPQHDSSSAQQSGSSSSGNNIDRLSSSSSYPRAGSIQLTVKDSGIGLTKEQLNHLFAEGVQFDANRLQHGGGSGLGLSIAKGLVEQHGGTIMATSEGQGYGTTFIIELPLYKLTSEEQLDCNDKGDVESQQHLAPSVTTTTNTSLDSWSEYQPGAGRRPKRRILVAEDAVSSLKMLIRLLEREGHTCVGVENGKLAVDAIEQDLLDHFGSIFLTRTRISSGYRYGGGDIVGWGMGSGSSGRIEQILCTDYRNRKTTCQSKMLGLLFEILCIDFNYKIAPKIHVCNQGRGFKPYQCMVTIQNEHNETVYYKLCKNSESMAEIEKGLRQLGIRNREDVKVIYVDNCCDVRTKPQEIFPNAEIKLDPWHWFKRFDDVLYDKKSEEASTFRGLLQRHVFTNSNEEYLRAKEKVTKDLMDKGKLKEGQDPKREQTSKEVRTTIPAKDLLLTNVESAFQYCYKHDMEIVVRSMRTDDDTDDDDNNQPKLPNPFFKPPSQIIKYGKNKLTVKQHIDNQKLHIKNDCLSDRPGVCLHRRNEDTGEIKCCRWTTSDESSNLHKVPNW